MRETKKVWVKELKPGMTLEDTFLVTSLTQEATSAGIPYVKMSIMDKTGSLEAKLWETKLSDFGVKSGDVAWLRIAAKDYKGKVDCSIKEWRQAEVKGLGDYIKASEHDPDEMWARFLPFVSGFESSYFNSVAADLFDVIDTEKFKLAPAATGMHHAFLHGLLEHTLQMLQIGNEILKFTCFKDLNRDLCLFGIMFHDFGKIYEYSTDVGFKKLLEGVLVPHIPMVAAKIYASCEKLGVPDEVRNHMMHVVLAHHRFMKWGSPVTFACPEASFVHHVDNLHGGTFGLIQKREEATGETIKHGYGDDVCTLVAKPFNQILKELEEVPNGF